MDASLRKEVWPFLLGHYQFGMSEDERKEVCNVHNYGIFLPPELLSFDLLPITSGGRAGASVLPADDA